MKNRSNPNIFSIPIGDWSGDGHSQCKYFFYHSNKSLDEIREGYFKSKESFPDLCPENFCDEYEDNSISVEQFDLLNKHFPDLFAENSVSEEKFANFVIEFIKLSVSDFYVEKIDFPMLQFYGFKDGKHIGSIGYGLF